MIIKERDADDGEFLFAPIYYLTGDLETAKFYSNLASATSKFGTYLEQKIRELISLPVEEYDSLKSCLFPLEQKCLLRKQKIVGVEPDFIIIDPINKLILVFEVKTNMFNMDSKQCKTENYTGSKIKQHFMEILPEYTTEVYLVNFFGFEPSKRGKYVTPLTDNFKHINGEIFSEMVDISLETLMNNLKDNQLTNQKFITDYKSKPIEVVNA